MYATFFPGIQVNYSVPLLFGAGKSLPLTPTVADEANSDYIALGKEAVRIVKKLGLQSSTYHTAIMEQLTAEEQLLEPTVWKRLAQHKDRQVELNQLGTLFRNRLRAMPIDSLDAFVEALVRLSLEMRYANCTEQAILAAKYLKDKKGFTDFAIIGVDMVEPEDFEKYRRSASIAINRHCKDHTFLVLGLNAQADLTKPDTWNKDAVIVDPWAGFVLPLEEGISRICQFFSLSPNANMFFNNWVDDLDLPFKDQKSPYDWKNISKLKQPFIIQA